MRHDEHNTPMPWDIPGAPHPRDYGLSVANEMSAIRKKNEDTSIYVASSWRNLMQQAVVLTLDAAGFAVYDFKNPPNNTGFHWSEVGLPNTIGARANDEVEIDKYLKALEDPRSIEGFKSDFDAMKAADIFVLVLPCGRSAHLELGWAVGAGKRTCIYAPEESLTPELMYKMVDHIAPTMMDLLGWLGVED
jgi:hypothetical protein